MKNIARQSAGTACGDELDRLLYADETVSIGYFDCPRHHPLFEDSGPASGDLVVFPRDAVEISHPDHQPVVASPQVITLYNRNQEYQRRAVSAYGDRCMWLRFQREAVVEALIDAGRTHPGLESAPFASAWSNCSATTYLQARKLLKLVQHDAPVVDMVVQEMAFELLQSAIEAIPADAPPSAQRAATRRRHRQLAARCRELLASRYSEPLTLASIAHDLATTPFHLSRVFSEYNGQTLHEYLMSLRLRVAVDCMLEQPARRLTDISADLCFATPSHFSQRFRSAFGASPGAFRRRWSAHT